MFSVPCSYSMAYLQEGLISQLGGAYMSESFLPPSESDSEYEEEGSDADNTTQQSGDHSMIQEGARHPERGHSEHMYSWPGIFCSGF